MVASILAAADTATAGGGDASAWLAAGLVLLAAAIVLGVVEIFVPTGGLLAVATATCLVGSVVMFFMHGPLWGFASLLAYSAGAPFAVVLGFKLWSRSPIARKMVLGQAAPDESGEMPATRAPGPVAVGTEGIAETPLRPVGFVRFGGQRIEAVAELGMIDAGAAVVVVESGPARVAVRRRD